MTELIEYTTATKMAGVYRESVAKLKSLILEIGEERRKLQEVFDSAYGFDVDVYFDGSRHDCNADTIAAMADNMKRSAWGALIEKLGIRKLMSSKRAGELDDAIHNRRGRYNYDERAKYELPEINEETIYAVLSGMCQSADEFLSEAIREEHDFWKPSKREAPYKRNSEFTLNRKVIHGWMVERAYGGGWRTCYSNESHLIALDRIFHALDGQGIPKGHGGPLVDAIKVADADGKFSTSYFEGRCFGNGNVHLTFKRLDLLEKFNAVAGRNRLPASAA